MFCSELLVIALDSPMLTIYFPIFKMKTTSIFQPLIREHYLSQSPYEIRLQCLVQAHVYKTLHFILSSLETKFIIIMPYSV